MSKIKVQRKRPSHFAAVVVAVTAGLSFTAGADAQANVNETLATNIVYASSTGSDSNNGLTAGTPKTLNGAISAIGTKSTKIILLDGDYRHWVSLPSGNNVLILQAQTQTMRSPTVSNSISSSSK